jgi:hypothetical protein
MIHERLIVHNPGGQVKRVKGGLSMPDQEGYPSITLSLITPQHQPLGIPEKTWGRCAPMS